MSPVVEVGLIAQRELRRNFRSVKGIVMGVLTLLGGIGIALLRLKVEQLNAGQFDADDVQQVQSALLVKQYGDEMGHYLAKVPPILLGMLVITVWLCPLLVSVLGFDSISAEMQHRTLRYFTMRTRRASYLVGKTVGLWLVVSIITLVLHFLVWLLITVRGGTPTSVGFGWGLHLWLLTLPISAAWCGFATLIGSQFKSPILALMVTFAIFFVLFVLGLVGAVSQSAHWVGYIYPNTFEEWLLSPHANRVAQATAICFGWAAASTALAATLFARKDV